VGVDESGSGAICVRQENCVTVRTSPSLNFTWGERNDEVSVHGTSYLAVDGAWSVCKVARTRARTGNCYKAPILELFDDSNAARVSEHGEVPVEHVGCPVVSTSPRVRRIACIWPIVLCLGRSGRWVDECGQVEG